jgi:hypothetical protein
MDELMKKDAAYLLALLDSDAVMIPGGQSERLTSGKMLLRGILEGTIMVSFAQQEPPPEADEDDTSE